MAEIKADNGCGNHRLTWTLSGPVGTRSRIKLCSLNWQMPLTSYQFYALFYWTDEILLGSISQISNIIRLAWLPGPLILLAWMNNKAFCRYRCGNILDLARFSWLAHTGISWFAISLTAQFQNHKISSSWYCSYEYFQSYRSATASVLQINIIRLCESKRSKTRCRAAPPGAVALRVLENTLTLMFSDIWSHMKQLQRWGVNKGKKLRVFLVKSWHDKMTQWTFTKTKNSQKTFGKERPHYFHRKPMTSTCIFCIFIYLSNCGVQWWIA